MKNAPGSTFKIAAMESCLELGQKVNDYIVSFRQNTINEVTESPIYVNYRSNNYLVDCACPRFGSGEAKGMLKESIRGTDLFIMTDVCNYSLIYTVNGHLNHMSPGRSLSGSETYHFRRHRKGTPNQRHHAVPL